MSDATQIAREAKALQQGLKELLRTRDILDREIDIQRKNLRRQYLRLILLHPYAKESKDAETHLWMQTSYAIIANYKQRLTNLDRAIYGPPLRHTHPQPHPHNQNAQPPPVVEHKRLLQRFRQFLAEEEKFWTQLVLRLRRNFAVEDAQPALVALGLSQDGDPQQQQDHSPNNNNNNRRNPFQFPPDSDTPNDSLLPSSVAQRESRLAIVCKAIVCLGDIARYKELYNESGGRPRAGHEDGQSAILSVKASRGKRASAHANHTQTSRSRDYSKAQKCYEEARLLIPSDGNPSHQLAIISSYQKDIFNSLFHYYRALCVKQPYDTASENLGSILRKQLSVWRSVGVKKERERDEKERMGLLEEDRRPPIFRVDEFKDKLAVVHAQWRFGDHDTDHLADKVAKEYENLVAERIIPTEIISKVIILSQGALWKHRMIRQQPSERKQSSSSSSSAIESRITSHVLALHESLLQIGTAQLKEAAMEEQMEGEAGAELKDDLAQRITATFRRTLPALRMSGKWIRGNLRYLSQAQVQAERPGQLHSAEEPPVANDAESRGGKGKGRDTRREKPPRTTNTISLPSLPSFWLAYVTFINSLLESFPVEKIPRLTAPLEEDTEVVGFLPLKKFMLGHITGIGGAIRPGSPKDGAGGGGNAKAEKIVVVVGVNGKTSTKQVGAVKAIGRDQVHPNEEQLMRISDMLVDANAVAEDGNSPIKIVDNKFEYTGHPEDTELIVDEDKMETSIPSELDGIPVEDREVSTTVPPPAEDEDEGMLETNEYEEEDEDDVMDGMTESGRTEDDLLQDAFRQALGDGDEDEGDDDDDDGDEIVWNPRANLSSHDLSIIAVDPITPQHTSPVSPRNSDLTPPRVAPPPPQPIFRPTESKKVQPTPMALAGIATGTKNSTIAPAKTAQDLLNNVMGLSRPSVANVTVPSPSVSSTLGMSSNMPGTSVGIISPLAGSQPQQQYTPHHTRGASSPGGVVVPFLFGSSDPIWSSGLDGGALGYGGVGRSPPSMARTGQQGGSPPGTLRRTSQPGLVGQAQQLQQQQGNLWAGGITTPPLLNQKQPQLQQQQQYSMQNQPQSRSLGPQAGLGLSHQRGISESLVSGAGKRYFGGFPSSPPMQQMPQPQQQEPLQGVLGGRRYDARLEGAQELGGLSGGIGFGISQQQQQQIPSFADTIYSSPPNAGAYYQSQQQQPSRGRGTGSVGNVGGIGLGVGPGVVGERGGLGFNANPGISMASTLKAQQNFAASPYMSSTSIWGQTGFKPSGWC